MASQLFDKNASKPPLSGNRVLLRTGQKCLDLTKQPQDLSVVVDHVHESQLKENSDSMYRLYYDMKDIDTDFATQLKQKLGGICVPVSIYLDEKRSKTSSGYVTPSDLAKIDSAALVEPFDPIGDESSRGILQFYFGSLAVLVVYMGYCVIRRLTWD